jgi:hypothetical protein
MGAAMAEKDECYKDRDLLIINFYDELFVVRRDEHDFTSADDVIDAMGKVPGYENWCSVMPITIH